MTYEEKLLSLLKYVQNTQRKASTMWNFLMLNLVVSKKNR